MSDDDSAFDEDNDEEITDYSSSGDDDEDDPAYARLQSSIKKFQSTAANNAGAASTAGGKTTSQNMSENVYAGGMSKPGEVSMESLLGVLGQTSGASALSKQMKDMEKNIKAPSAIEKVVAHRLERKEVYSASKGDMKKWQDIVVENRHARTLDIAQDKHQLPSYKTLISKYVPENDFEKEVQMVLVKSGTAETEANLNEMDELTARSMSLEEIREKQADIAKANSLMFYEQMKRHRINRIKSKAFRRIHKKQKERLKRQGIDLLAETDEDTAQAIIEEQTLNRIKERMNLRHKNTGKWAKMALSVHGKRDSSVRSAYHDQIQLGQELLKKVNAGNDSNDDDDDSEGSDDYDSDGNDGSRNMKSVNRMKQDLQSVLENTNGKKPEISGKYKKLFEMDFMKNAAETQNARMKDQAKAMLREIEEEMDYSDDESGASDRGDAATSGNNNTINNNTSGSSNDKIKNSNSNSNSNSNNNSSNNNGKNSEKNVVPSVIEDAGFKLVSSKKQKRAFSSNTDDMETANTSVAAASSSSFIESSSDNGNSNSNISSGNKSKSGQGKSTEKDQAATAQISSNPWLSNSTDSKKLKSKSSSSSNTTTANNTTNTSATNSNPRLPTFIPTSTFSGAKPGYSFTTGKQGIGYYLDSRIPSASASASASSKVDSNENFLSFSKKSSIDAGAKSTQGSNNTSIIPSFKKGSTAATINPSSTESLATKEKGNEKEKKEEKKSLIAARSQNDLVHEAFAGPDLEKEFASMKEKTIRDELGFDDKRKKVVSDVKAGWGDWAGPGEMMVSDKIKRIRDFKVKKIEAEEAEKLKTRSDRKLPNVMISERKVKTASKFMVAEVPHPFETREQYERSLQMPLGEDWNASHVYRKNTKPDVLIRSGRLIDPIALPKENRKRAREGEEISSGSGAAAKNGKKKQKEAPKLPRKIR